MRVWRPLKKTNLQWPIFVGQTIPICLFLPHQSSISLPYKINKCLYKIVTDYASELEQCIKSDSSDTKKLSNTYIDILFFSEPTNTNCLISIVIL